MHGNYPNWCILFCFLVNCYVVNAIFRLRSLRTHYIFTPGYFCAFNFHILIFSHNVFCLIFLQELSKQEHPSNPWYHSINAWIKKYSKLNLRNLTLVAIWTNMELKLPHSILFGCLPSAVNGVHNYLCVYAAHACSFN